MSKSTTAIIAFVVGFVLATLVTCNWREKVPCPEVVGVDTTHKTGYAPAETIESDNLVPVRISVFEGGKISQGANRLHPVLTNKPTNPTAPLPDTPVYVIDTTGLQHQGIYVRSDYDLLREYDETYRFSAGTVRVKNGVARNQLQYQRATLDSIRKDTVVITKTLQIPAEKKKLKGYGLFGFGFDKLLPVRQLSIGAGLQFKNDQQLFYKRNFNLSGMPGPLNEVMWLPKISFKK